jgi:septal ring factor EnvC (AmiA/AmiB activator)
VEREEHYVTKSDKWLVLATLVASALSIAQVYRLSASLSKKDAELQIAQAEVVQCKSSLERYQKDWKQCVDDLRVDKELIGQVDSAARTLSKDNKNLFNLLGECEERTKKTLRR